MSDVHRWDCDCEFHNPDWTADKISVVRASDFDALRAERDRYEEALKKLMDLCEASDDAQYGTLSTTCVSVIARAALEPKEKP